MIGVVVRGMSTLKILQPIMLELYKDKQQYIMLYCTDAPKKKFNDSSLENIKESSRAIVKNATKCIPYSNTVGLMTIVKKHNIKKFVGVEIYGWTNKYFSEFKKNGVKLYNISFLIDYFWHKDKRCITAMDRVYYTTKYTKETLHKFLGISHNQDRDRLLGSPILPYPKEEQNNGKHLLVLLPNLTKHEYGLAFGHEQHFRFSIRQLATQHDLLLKARPKQWFNKEIKKYTKGVITDTNKIYPPPTWDVLKKSHTTMLYYSSGIFEVVCSGNYALNIPISLKRYKSFGWPKDRLCAHFSTKKQGLYNYEGVVESVRMCSITDGKWQLTKKIDPVARKKWIEEFVGPVYENSAKEIVNDIINS